VPIGIAGAGHEERQCLVDDPFGSVLVVAVDGRNALGELGFRDRMAKGTASELALSPKRMKAGRTSGINLLGEMAKREVYGGR
jgi:hypothetical protein